MLALLAATLTLGDWRVPAPQGTVLDETEECFSEGIGGRVDCLTFLPKELARRRKAERDRKKMTRKELKTKKKLGPKLGDRIATFPESVVYVQVSPKLASRYECMTGCAFDGEQRGETVDAEYHGHKVYMYTCSRSDGKTRYQREHVLLCPQADEGGLDLVLGWINPKDRDKWIEAFHGTVMSLKAVKSQAAGAVVPALSTGAAAGGAP